MIGRYLTSLCLSFLYELRKQVGYHTLFSQRGTDFKNVACGKKLISIGVDPQRRENDKDAPDQEGLNEISAVYNCLSRLTLKNRQVSSYLSFLIYFILHVDATHRPLKLMRLLHFKNNSIGMDIDTNNEIHDTFMRDSWFASVPTDQYIRRGGGRFKGTVNIIYSLFPKAES